MSIRSQTWISFGRLQQINLSRDSTRSTQLESAYTQTRVESNPVQTLESRGVHTDRVQSNQVCASSSGF